MKDEIGLDEARTATGALAGFARACASHPWRVVGGWFVATLILIGLTIGFHGKLQNEFKLPGSDTQRASDLLKEKFPDQNGSSLSFVIQAPAGERIDTPQRKVAIAKIQALSKKAEHATRETSPFDEGHLSDTGRVGYYDQTFSKQGFELSHSKIVDLEDAAQKIGKTAGLNVQFTGDADSGPPDSGTSEQIGLMVAFVILLILFRALVPTLIPLLFAIIAVASAFALLYLAASVFKINTITPIIASMIGLGVGIDYSLFIVTRFRQLLHDGMSPREAAAGSASTAGRAVIFAGVTVAISITGLFVIGLPFITVMGFGGALGVLTSVLLANTLLPAVLVLVGHRIDAVSLLATIAFVISAVIGAIIGAVAGLGAFAALLGLVVGVVGAVLFARRLEPNLRARFGPKVSSLGLSNDDSVASQQRTPVAKWGRLVTRKAPIALAAALIITLAIASPALKVRLGAADAGTAPKSQTTRQAYDILSDKKDGFGPGFTSPVTIVVKGGKADADKVKTALDTLKGKGSDKPIEFVATPFSNKAGDVSIINVNSKYSPQDVKTDDLVSTLRKHTVPGTGVTAYVTGQNAAFTDIGHQILSQLPWFLLFVIGVTMIVLAMAFRSLVISIKAALTTLLSAFVGFGALVGIVQLGHGLSLFGLDRTGPIESFVPPIAFAILFGLSMDYEVFLMSRVREEHVHGKPTRQALTDGIAGVGRVVVAACLIMSAVFFSFTIGDDRVSKEFGMLLAIAILCDALIVRLTLVPALLTLLGERSWLIPKWLDRALPRITIEPPVEPKASSATAHGSEPALSAD